MGGEPLWPHGEHTTLKVETPSLRLRHTDTHSQNMCQKKQIQRSLTARATISHLLETFFFGGNMTCPVCAYKRRKTHIEYTKLSYTTRDRRTARECLRQFLPDVVNHRYKQNEMAERVLCETPLDQHTLEFCASRIDLHAK